jgi:hypothetical protein
MRLLLSIVVSFLFVFLFVTAILLESLSGFVFDSKAVVQAAREINLYGELSGLFEKSVYKFTYPAPHLAADVSEEEKKLAETFWKKGCIKVFHDAVPEPLFYEMTDTFHRGLVVLATGGADALVLDTSRIKGTLSGYLNEFDAAKQAEALHLNEAATARVVGWHKGLSETTDRIPAQYTVRQLVEVGGGNKQKFEESLARVRRNLERFNLFKRGIRWAAVGSILGVALFMLGSLRRVSLTVGLALLAGGLTCKYATEGMADFFLRRARVRAVEAIADEPSQTKDRIFAMTGTVVRHAIHYADGWVHGSLALGTGLAGVGLLSVFIPRRKAPPVSTPAA